MVKRLEINLKSYIVHPAGYYIDAKLYNMSVTKEQLLVEAEDLLRNVPQFAAFQGRDEASIAWLGRFAAVVRMWDSRRSADVYLCQMQIKSPSPSTQNNGYDDALRLLHEMRNALRMETVGPLAVSLGHGQIFDYFDEVRHITKEAKQDLFFVDPYLNAEFVSRYLVHISEGVVVRLLAREKLAELIPAVDLFAKQSKLMIAIRSAPNFHDRYVFVDHNACYQSGASFKDGARLAPTTLTQITDAFAAVLQTYEALWNGAKIVR